MSSCSNSMKKRTLLFFKARTCFAKANHSFLVVSVGIGSDYDGIESVPKGLEDVSKYPYLVSSSFSLFLFLRLPLTETNSLPPFPRPRRMFHRQFAELIKRGWSKHDLSNLAGGNLLRAMRGMEDVSRHLKEEQGKQPSMAKYDKRRDLDGGDWDF